MHGKLVGTFLLLGLSAVTMLLVNNVPELKYRVIIMISLSILAYYATVFFIPIVKHINLRADLFGKDINKNLRENLDKADKVPEALGIVPATIYFMVIISFAPFFKDTLGEYHAALTSICMMVFLGFADDVLDLRWSVKIFFSFFVYITSFNGIFWTYNGNNSKTFP